MTTREQTEGLATALLDELRGLAGRIGADLRHDVAEQRLYLAEQAEYLASIVGLPGQEEATRATAEAVAMRLLRSGIEGADRLDERWREGVRTGLGVLASALRVL